jgi:GTP pyrophosphokinase
MENKELFFKRLYPFFGPSVLHGVELAYILAKYGHRDQVRKEPDAEGNPLRYFEHVRRVALILIDEAKCIRPEMVISAVLHDTIEDAKSITPALIEHTFGSDVCSIVKVLSKDPKEGYLDRFMTCTDWRPYLIKACDRLDNLRSLSSATPEFQEKQIRETRDKYLRLFDRMLVLTPEVHRDGARRVYEEVQIRARNQ